MSQGLLFSEKEMSALSADLRMREIRDRGVICQKCKLWLTRTSVVLGAGCIDHPPIAFVGEGPGANEDREGKPFVGKAGTKLDEMLHAMGITREQVFLCNVVACRPPENRVPEPDETKACKEFLVGQLRCVQPKIIVALGATAAAALLGKGKTVKETRGKWLEWEETPVRVTYHPAGILRDPSKAGEAWKDLQSVMRKLGLTSKFLPTPTVPNP